MLSPKPPSRAQTAVLVVAHGSRRPEAADELEQTARQLEDRLGDLPVRTAFLELNAPSIPDGLRQCIERGARRIVVVPWFLNTGRHLAEDVPSIVADVRQEHPDVSIEMATHIGGHPGLVELLGELVKGNLKPQTG